MMTSYLGSLAYKSWKLTKIMPNSLKLLNHYILSNAPQKIRQWALKADRTKCLFWRKIEETIRFFACAAVSVWGVDIITFKIYDPYGVSMVDQLIESAVNINIFWMYEENPYRLGIQLRPPNAAMFNGITCQKRFQD